MLLSMVLGGPGRNSHTKLCSPTQQGHLPPRVWRRPGPSFAPSGPPRRARRLQGAVLHEAQERGTDQRPEFPPLSEKSRYPSFPTNMALGQKPAHRARLGFRGCASWGAASSLLLMGKKELETLSFLPGAGPSRRSSPAFLPSTLGAQGDDPGRVVLRTEGGASVVGG